MVRRWLADALRLSGDAASARVAYAAARAELSYELASQPENFLLVAELAIVQARLQDLNGVNRLLATCSELAAKSRRELLVVQCLNARIQVSLAIESPSVVALLREALSHGGELPPLTPALLARDPDFDGLRENPDFQALL